MMGGAPQGAPAPAPQQPPSAAPANPLMMNLAKLYQLCSSLAQSNPVIAAGMQKAAEGIQEAQSALVTQPQPQPMGATPPY
jgi:hypothetical protein